MAAQLPMRLLLLLAGMIPAPRRKPRRMVDQHRLQRLGIVPDEVPGCHCAALSRPKEPTDLLVSYLD